MHSLYLLFCANKMLEQEQSFSLGKILSPAMQDNFSCTGVGRVA
jgi:hypothetical protein